MRRKKGVIGFFVHHKVAGNLVMLMMLLAGALALTRMNVQFFPTFALDVVSVRVVWSGASAEDVEQGLNLALQLRPGFADGIPLRSLPIIGNDTKFFERIGQF